MLGPFTHTEPLDWLTVVMIRHTEIVRYHCNEATVKYWLTWSSVCWGDPSSDIMKQYLLC